MSLPKKGSRKIVVDGLEYRWTIRRKPTYGQREYKGQKSYAGMTVGIERILETKGSILLVELYRARPDGEWLVDKTPITPKIIEQYICTALEKGWQADRVGKPFILKEV
jgi:hypothetical protein